MLAGSGRFALTRRGLLGGAACSGAALAGLPLSALRAQDSGSWQNVRRFVESYAGARKVANMQAAFGVGMAPLQMVSAGPDTLGGERAADADSLYRIYSMTKPVTGMAAMILVDEGRLGLDQPLHTILPGFAEMRVQKVYDGPITSDNLEPAVRPITIRHLLTHTAGLGYSIIQQGPLSAAMTEKQVIPGQVTRADLPQFMRGKPAESLELFADRAAELPLVYQPGTRWSYSIGLDVLGRVIEVVSGQPFDEFLQERIFDPCGMSSTFFRVPASEQHRLTSNYGVLEGLLLPIDPASNSIYLDEPAFPFGGAGLVSSARDYDRFLHMLADRGARGERRVMSEQAVLMGTSDLLPPTMDPEDEVRRNYGFGAGGRVGFGPLRQVFGWAGAAGTIGFVDMGSRRRFGLYTQYMPMQAYPLLDEFPEAVLADLVAQGAAA